MEVFATGVPLSRGMYSVVKWAVAMGDSQNCKGFRSAAGTRRKLTSLCGMEGFRDTSSRRWHCTIKIKSSRGTIDIFYRAVLLPKIARSSWNGSI